MSCGMQGHVCVTKELQKLLGAPGAGSSLAAIAMKLHMCVQGTCLHTLQPCLHNLSNVHRDTAEWWLHTPMQPCQHMLYMLRHHLHILNSLCR